MPVVGCVEIACFLGGDGARCMEFYHMKECSVK